MKNSDVDTYDLARFERRVANRGAALLRPSASATKMRGVHPGTHHIAEAKAPVPIMVASVMRPHGGTGMQTHFRTFLNVLKTVNHPATLVTPFDSALWQVYPMFGLRKPIQVMSSSASVWWHRHWHGHFLAQELRYQLRNDPCCTIYAQCPPSAAAALNARRSARQRVAMVVHFNISQADEWVEKGMISMGGGLYHSIRKSELELLPQLDGLVFVSEFMRRELLARIPAIARIPYAVLPNFVDNPQLRQSDDYDADLISIGSLEPRKNQTYLLDIVAAAKRQGTRLRVTIAGEGPDRTMLEARTRELGIGDQVRFLGYVPNAPRLLARHRAYIHNATMENMPLTLIESLAHGVPVFAPAVGGIPEIFKDGVEGRLLPLNDAEVAAHFVTEWLKSPLIMRAASCAARLRFLHKFESQTVGAQLTRFLTSISSPA